MSKFNFEWEMGLVPLIKKKKPDAYKLCYPRRFRVPSTHYDPALFVASAELADFTLKESEKSNGDDVNEIALRLGFSALIGDGVQTLFVEQDLAEAMVNTTPPKDFAFKDLLWPYPSMLVIPPKKFAEEYFGAMIPHMIAASVPNKEDERKFIMFGAKAFDLKGDCYGFICDAAVSGDNLRLDDLIHENREVSAVGEPTINVEETRRITKLTTSFLVNLLLFMSHAPYLVENQRVIIPAQTRGKGKDKVVVREGLWEPRWVGKNYKRRMPSVPHGGHHSSPRMHWRKGHWHTVLSGKGRINRDLKWFEPVFVNKPEEDNDSDTIS